MTVKISTLMEETLFAHGGILKALLSKFPEKNLLSYLTLTEVIEDPNLESLPKTDIEDADSDFEVFSEIEAIVAEYRLPDDIENYLWAYPVYRKLTEGLLSPTQPIPSQTLSSVIEEIVDFGKQWLEFICFKFKPGLSAAEKEELAHHWTRFQTRVLEKSGQSRFRVI